MRFLGVVHHIRLSQGNVLEELGVSKRDFNAALAAGHLKNVGRRTFETDDVERAVEWVKTLTPAHGDRLRIGIEADPVVMRKRAKEKYGLTDALFFKKLFAAVRETGARIIPLEEGGEQKLLWVLKQSFRTPLLALSGLTGKQMLFVEIANEEALKVPGFNYDEFADAVDAFRTVKHAEKTQKARCDGAIVGLAHGLHAESSGHEVALTPLARIVAASPKARKVTSRQLLVLEKYREALQKALERTKIEAKSLGK